ncbi:MAG TPA: DinB family protein [Ktedonobacteraceae bacterium]|nr:DinB family protein [Ktedonobacteraceae bacterium]
MNLVDFLRVEQRRLHEWTRDCVKDLRVEQWPYTQPGTSNHIAFLVWHSVRTEDNVLRFVLQGRQPTWNEENWHERLGLPPRVQGTGMPTVEAQSLHINDPALFMQYVEQVWLESEAYLASIDDGGAALSERIVKVKPLGEMPAIRAIGQVCVSHLFTHLGEISLLCGAQGKQGSPI